MQMNTKNLNPERSEFGYNIELAELVYDVWPSLLRCFLKLSIPCFVLSSATEMRALYLSIGFSSPL